MLLVAFVREFILGLLIILASSSMLSAEDQIILLGHEAKFDPQGYRQRNGVSDGRIEISAVHSDTWNGDAAEAYPGIRSDHLKAGSLEAEGLCACAGSGRFAGYAVSRESFKPTLRVDFGFDPGTKRGIAFTPTENLGVYWIRAEEEAELGGYWSMNRPIAADFCLQRERFFDGPDAELSADGPHIGRSEELIRIASGIRGRPRRFGSVSILGAHVFLPSSPGGSFVCIGGQGKFTRWEYDFSADYTSERFVFSDGVVSGRRRNASAGLVLFPGAVCELWGRGHCSDGGVDLLPDLYHYSSWRASGGAILRLWNAQIQTEQERGVDWETDGAGEWKRETSLTFSMELEGLRFEILYEIDEGGETGKGDYQENRVEMKLDLDFDPLELMLNLESDGEAFSWELGIETEVTEKGSVYAAYGEEKSLPSWSIGWKIEGGCALQK